MEYLLSKRNDSEQPASEKCINFLFVSNLIESKGVYVLLDACAILQQNRCVFNTFLVGGEGDIKEDGLIQKIKDLNLVSRVHYLGTQYDKAKHKLFSDSDVFVFPTFYSNETLGIVNIEAMQFKMPIITCNEGGIPDIVIDGKNGFIIPENDHKALAEKMQWFIENPAKIKEMGEIGFQYFKEKFTLEIFERKLTNILIEELAIKQTFKQLQHYPNNYKSHKFRKLFFW